MRYSEISGDNFAHNIALLSIFSADDVTVCEKLFKNIHISIVQTYEVPFVKFFLNTMLYLFSSFGKDVGVTIMGPSGYKMCVIA